MHIRDISNEFCAKFVKNFLSNVKSENISRGPIKIQNIKRSDNFVQVFAKQCQKHLVHNTKLIQKYVATFESVADETIIATIEMDIAKGIDPMKIDVSKYANQFFEDCLQQTEECVLQ